ncbi:hypothetical protein HAX54_046405 [Datura stramonium]|uniref:Uncharacterized protein n=1 Tax=Datura stramonium TaxID=4076 RepID=A0ABS8SR97_DATST|nr:hypothetical protein [Datura stramonium]
MLNSGLAGFKGVARDDKDRWFGGFFGRLDMVVLSSLELRPYVSVDLHGELKISIMHTLRQGNNRAASPCENGKNANKKTRNPTSPATFHASLASSGHGSCSVSSKFSNIEYYPVMTDFSLHHEGLTSGGGNKDNTAKHPSSSDSSSNHKVGANSKRASALTAGDGKGRKSNLASIYSMRTAMRNGHVQDVKATCPFVGV